MPVYNPPFLANSQSNSLRSYFLYDHRRWYREKTDEIFNSFNPNYIDLWRDVPFYGKVDTKGKIVIPNMKKMTFPLTSGAESVGFDFMVKATNEFFYFLQRGAVAGRTNLQKLLNNFKIKKGFVNAIDLAVEENVLSIEAFNSLAHQNIYVKKQITDFSNYVCEAVKFFASIEQDFTFFKYFSSSKVGLRSTGLCVEFSNDSHNNDLKKNKYFTSPEFYKYVQTAANFGFRINKNAPWMLVADLNSKPMLTGRTVKRGYSRTEQKTREIHVDGYLQEKFIPNLETFFNEYYESAMEYSFYLFVSSLVAGYAQYLNNIRYLTKEGDIKIEIGKYNKIFNNVGITRGKQMIKRIKPLQNQIIDTFFLVEQYEKSLKNEFKGVYNKSNYKSFYKKFKKIINTSNKGYTESMELLEDFYTPVKIYNPDTKKLFWNQPKKELTQEKSYANLQEKSKPTAGKIVTEFIADI